MKYAFAAAGLLPLAALASPMAQHHQHLDKRALVTNVVHATRVLYQDQVVYVDENGTPYSTGVVPVSTQVIVAAPAQTPAAAPPAAFEAPASSAPAPAPEAPSPSSQAPAPAPETSSPAPPPPAPTTQAPPPPPPSPTTQAPPPTTQVVSQPAPSPSSSSGSGSGSGSGSTFSGDATFYAPGLGACGGTSTEDDLICALNESQFEAGTGANSNSNSNCGKKIEITRPDNGKKVQVTVVDMCPGCAYGSLDLSPAAFNEIADPSEGRVNISWQWV